MFYYFGLESKQLKCNYVKSRQLFVVMDGGQGFRLNSMIRALTLKSGTASVLTVWHGEVPLFLVQYLSISMCFSPILPAKCIRNVLWSFTKKSFFDDIRFAKCPPHGVMTNWRKTDTESANFSCVVISIPGFRSGSRS